MAIPTITPEAIKRLIERIGCTQRAFGEMVGVPQSSVARWVTGTSRPNSASTAKLRKLADDFAALDLLDMETEAAAAWEGTTHILRAMDAAEQAGLSLATTYSLLPSALHAKDEGLTAAQWALTIHERGQGHILERAIPEMQGAGLWPWEDRPHRDTMPLTLAAGPVMPIPLVPGGGPVIPIPLVNARNRRGNEQPE